MARLSKKKSNARPLPVASLAWVRRKSWPNGHIRSKKSLSLVDLFCGCGGMSLGVWEAARLAGSQLRIRLAIDEAKEPLAVYRDNFECREDTAIAALVESVFDGSVGDRLTKAERNWRKRIGQVDLLVAGPPCQGHSDLNNSTRRNDPRNQLYLRVVRAAEVLEPDVVIIENVPAVLLDRTRVVETAVDDLGWLDYHVSQGPVRLSQLGVPQTRKRHVLVASRSPGFDLGTWVKEAERPTPMTGEFINGLEDEPEEKNGPFCQPSRMTSDNERRVKFLFKQDVHDLPNRLRPPCHRDKDHAYVSMYGRMHWDRPAQTITSGFGSMGQGRFVHPTRPRMLTAHEAARLQGFPDFFDFSSVKGVTALRAMIGNAVPPQLTALLVSRLLKEGHL